MHNEAKEGSGIYNTGALLIVQNDSTISGNTATDSGGGFYNHDAMIAESSTIDDNSAPYGGGFRNDGALTIASSTIGGRVSNHATIWGGAIYSEGGGLMTVMGSRILNNTATVNGGSVFTDQTVAGGTDVTGCRIVGNSDTSFYNNQNAVQHIATGNWWGQRPGRTRPVPTRSVAM